MMMMMMMTVILQNPECYLHKRMMQMYQWLAIHFALLNLFNHLFSLIIATMFGCFSPRAPLYDMSGHEDKILAADWSNQEIMLSGGADNQLKIFKTSRDRLLGCEL